ncbi:MAG: 50S ribosomal protein L34e [Candidatus Micrarchaeota archaeon]|nr:50S ribosomal protein L34e [Candidatus Micrarchaeota archaeon]
MTLPKNRSNSVRKITRRTPKGGTAVHYRRVVKGKRHSCSITGCALQAVSSVPALSKSGKRPNRKFGGNLTSEVSSRIIMIASRVKEGKLSMSDVDIRYLPYVKGLLSKK